MTRMSARIEYTAGLRESQANRWAAKALPRRHDAAQRGLFPGRRTQSDEIAEAIAELLFGFAGFLRDVPRCDGVLEVSAVQAVHVMQSDFEALAFDVDF